MIFTTACVAVGTFFVLFYLYRRRALQFFKKQGLSNPEPHWFLGNLLDFMNENRIKPVHDWRLKYGKIFGYFEGTTPIYVISDVDIAQEICIKQYSSFPARRIFALSGDVAKAEPVHMFVAEGSRWKRQRTIIAPSFSSGKLHAMLPMMQNCVDQFLKHVDLKVDQSDDKTSASVDMTDLWQRLTLDIIGECCFGIESSSFTKRTNPILQKLQFMFGEIVTKLPAFVIAAMVFPEFHYFFTTVNYVRTHILPSWLTSNAFAYLNETLDVLVKNRQDQNKNPIADARVDMLNSLLHTDIQPSYTAIRSTAALNDGDELCVATKNSTTLAEINQQCFLFLLAGYETSSNTLTFACHTLVKHPDIQEKLRDAVLKSGTSAEYLDWFVHEILRLYPIAAPVVTRRAIKPTQVTPDLCIPANVTVLINVWSIHYDADVWGPDVDQFRPERWSPDAEWPPRRDAFMAFGIGPRNCIGTRFALQEIKLALVALLTRYTLTAGPSFDHSATIVSASVIRLKDPVSITLTKIYSL